MECNFRVFQGVFLGQRKSMVFQGLPGFVGHPAIINVNITLIVIHIKSAPEHKVHFLPNTGIVCASYR